MEILSLKLSEHIYMVCDNGKSYEKDFGTWSYGDMGLCNEKWIFEKGTCRILDQLVEEYKQNFNKSHQTNKNYTNMNAQQARDVANKVNTDVINSQYRKIKSLIDYEANEGNFEL
jgi:ribosomal protein S17E